MKLNRREQKLIQKYDTPNALVVVTSYPTKGGESARFNAVANYSRELVRELAKQRPVIVLTESSGDKETKDIYIEDDALVIRVWHRDSMKLTSEIISGLKLFSNIDHALIQFEFSIFGGPLPTLSLLLMLLYLKLSNWKTSFVFHQVVMDLQSLAQHLGFGSVTSFKSRFFSVGMMIFYWLVGLLSTRVIVHNSTLKNRLSRLVSPEKIVVVPHGVSLPVNKLTRSCARKRLGYSNNEFVVLVFGYLNWYKGSDWIVDQIRQIQTKYPLRKIRLVLAGGESPTLNHKKHYREFVKNLYRKIETSRMVDITGYIPDDIKENYFAACDVVVLPYRVAMSESGPLTHAYAYGKPFMLSEARADSIKEKEALALIREKGLLMSQICFKLSGYSFENHLINLADKPEIRRQLSSLSRALARRYSWEEVGSIYSEAIFVQHIGIVNQLWSRLTYALAKA